MMTLGDAAQIPGTLITREYPYSPLDPDRFEYPFPSSVDQKLFTKYRERAEQIPELIVCGRLGEYKYYDMDQAIARAMTIFNRRIVGMT